MLAQNSSGFCLNGTTNSVTDAAQVTTFWCTEAVTIGDWIAFYDSDTTNPAGVAGQSVRKAVNSNADAVYGTFGVAIQTTTGAGMLPVQVCGFCNPTNPATGTSGCNVATGASGELAISSTAGRAEDYAGTNPELRVLGFTQAAASGNLAAVYLYEHPRLSA